MSIELIVFLILLAVVIAYATIEAVLGIKMERRAKADDKLFRAVQTANATAPKRSKLKSRKLWMAVLGVVLGFATVCSSYKRYPGFVTKAGVILMILSILIYIVMEAIVDLCGIEDKTYLYDDDAKKIDDLGKLIEDVDEALQAEIQNRTAADSKEALARIKADNEILHAAKKKLWWRK